MELSEAAWMEGTGGGGGNRSGSGGILAIGPRALTRGGLTPRWEYSYVVELLLCVVWGNVGSGARPGSLLGWGSGGVAMGVWGQQGKEGTITVRSGMAIAGSCCRKLSLSCRAGGTKVGKTPSLKSCTTSIL